MILSIEIFAAGMFYWITSLQVYNDGWNYMENLKRFVSSGMSDDTFIDAVSGIVNRGENKMGIYFLKNEKNHRMMNNLPCFQIISQSI